MKAEEGEQWMLVKSRLSQQPAKMETIILLADHNHLKYGFLLHEITIEYQHI